MFLEKNIHLQSKVTFSVGNLLDMEVMNVPDNDEVSIATKTAVMTTPTIDQVIMTTRPSNVLGTLSPYLIINKQSIKIF